MNVESKEIVGMQVTTDDVHDSQVFQRLVEEAEQHGTVVKVYGDGAYDSSQIYELLESKGVEPVIKPRRNSTLNTPPQPGEEWWRASSDWILNYGAGSRARASAGAWRPPTPHLNDRSENTAAQKTWKT